MKFDGTLFYDAYESMNKSIDLIKNIKIPVYNFGNYCNSTEVGDANRKIECIKEQFDILEDKFESTLISLIKTDNEFAHSFYNNMTNKNNEGLLDSFLEKSKEFFFGKGLTKSELSEIYQKISKDIKSESDLKEFINNNINEVELDEILLIISTCPYARNSKDVTFNCAGIKFNISDGEVKKLTFQNGLEVKTEYLYGFDGFCSISDYPTSIDLKAYWNGNPVSIYSECNIEETKYGGNQMVFSNNTGKLLSDDRINDIIKKYYPKASMEDKELLLARVTESGCGYTAAVNVLMDSYRGREEEFERNFGYPMYKIDHKTGSIKYNYEYLILENFLFVNAEDYSIEELADDMVSIKKRGKDEYASVSGESKDISTGSNLSTYEEFDNFLLSEYDVCMVVSANSYDSKTDVDKVLNEAYEDNIPIVIGVGGYELQDMNGNIYKYSDGRHAMQVTEIKENGDIYVTSWGEKYKLKLKEYDDVRIILYPSEEQFKNAANDAFEEMLDFV